MLSHSLKMPIFSSFIHSIPQMKSQLCFCEIWGSKWQSLWILLKVVIKTLKVTKGFFRTFRKEKGINLQAFSKVVMGNHCALHRFRE